MANIILALLALSCLPIICEQKHEVKEKSWVSDCNVSLHVAHILSVLIKATSAHDLTGYHGCLVGMHFISKQTDFKQLSSLLLLNDCFIPSEKSWDNGTDSKKITHRFYYKQTFKCVITLLLLISGNVDSNPGPVRSMECLQTPADFLNRSGIGFVHMNVRSLLPKIDLVRIWAMSTNADVMVLSETWLGRSIPDSHIFIDGYNIFRADRRAKGGGVAIYVRNTIQATVVLSPLLNNMNCLY